MDKVSIEEYKKGQKSLITIVVLFLMSQKFISKGLVSGAVKG